VNLTAWQPEDGPVKAVAVVEGLQDRQPDGVPVEAAVFNPALAAPIFGLQQMPQPTVPSRITRPADGQTSGLPCPLAA
jgi:hypothetical protein